MEENKLGEGFRMPTPITLSNTPIKIDLSDITIDAATCFMNAHQLAVKYPGIKIVEGILLMRNENDMLVTLPHVWNQLNDCYFDITKEMTNTAESLTYFVVKFHSIQRIKNADAFEYCFSTIENIAAIDNFISNQLVSKNYMQH